MNDSVLRGFCQKCEWPVQIYLDKPIHARLDFTKKNAIINFSGSHECSAGSEPEPVWFLSPQQMMVVIESNEFAEWDDPNYKRRYPTIGHRLARFCEEMPFFVARILKEGEKE